MLRNGCVALAHMLDATQLMGWGWASCRRFLPNPIECAFFYGKSRPHFLQIFRQDNVCFAVTKITFFPEMEAPTSAVSGPAGCFCPIWLHVKWSMELNLPKIVDPLVLGVH